MQLVLTTLRQANWVSTEQFCQGRASNPFAHSCCHPSAPSTIKTRCQTPVANPPSLSKKQKCGIGIARKMWSKNLRAPNSQSLSYASRKCKRIHEDQCRYMPLQPLSQSADPSMMMTINEKSQRKWVYDKSKAISQQQQQQPSPIRRPGPHPLFFRFDDLSEQSVFRPNDLPWAE